jgi:hypothetical protein
VSLHPSRFLLALALVLFAACSADDGDDVTSATLPAPATTETTDPPDPAPDAGEIGVDRVPGTVTIDYAQRVMDALDASRGAMFRQYKAQGGPTPDNLAWLRELYSEPELTRVEDAFGQMAAQDFPGIYPEPGDPETIGGRSSAKTVRVCCSAPDDRSTPSAPRRSRMRAPRRPRTG